MLSIKAREVEEEKKAVAAYGSSDSGASLGDILGAAIKEKQASAERAEAAALDNDEPAETESVGAVDVAPEVEDKTEDAEAAPEEEAVSAARADEESEPEPEETGKKRTGKKEKPAG